jgi:hypothetical protein
VRRRTSPFALKSASKSRDSYDELTGQIIRNLSVPNRWSLDLSIMIYLIVRVFREIARIFKESVILVGRPLVRGDGYSGAVMFERINCRTPFIQRGHSFALALLLLIAQSAGAIHFHRKDFQDGPVPAV